MTTSTLEGRSAVVTGASSGIGRAIAIALGGAAVRVTLGGRTESAMEDVKKIEGERYRKSQVKAPASTHRGTEHRAFLAKPARFR